MRRAWLIVAMVIVGSSGGCRWVECLCDLSDCESGMHKPWFHWYPCYLWSPGAKQRDDAMRGYFQEHPNADDQDDEDTSNARSDAESNA